MSFFSSEIDSMLENIKQQVGECLFCSHCHGSKPLANFLKGLTKNYTDSRLVKIPKVCDKMVSINERWNKVNNAVTNTKKSIDRLENLAPLDPEEHYEKLVALQVKLEAAMNTREEYRKNKALL